MKTLTELQEHNNFLKTQPLICREFYEYYKSKRKKVAKEIDQYKLFEKAVKGIIRVIKEVVAESTGGLHIKGLGYFCLIKKPLEYRNPLESNPNIRAKKKEAYVFWFYPDEKYKDWYLFYDEERRSLINKRDLNKKYTFEIDAVRTFYEMQEILKQL